LSALQLATQLGFDKDWFKTQVRETQKPGINRKPRGWVPDLTPGICISKASGY